MLAHGLPILATLALWWASTGLILLLDGLNRKTFRPSMVAASAALAVAIWFVVDSARQATSAAAYVAFACGLVAWGWQLLSFYTGVLTGPRKSACPPECRGLARFVEAVRASLYHELAAVLAGVVLFTLTYGRPNAIALWTYLILWWMHQSAKLNVFFGVPNHGEEMLPGSSLFQVGELARTSPAMR